MGGSAPNHIGKWNGTNWTGSGTGMNNDVLALIASTSNTYAGGRFTMAGDAAVNYIAGWNGSSWTNLGSGMNNAVYSLMLSGSDVYAGGTPLADDQDSTGAG